MLIVKIIPTYISLEILIYKLNLLDKILNYKLINTIKTLNTYFNYKAIKAI